MARRALDASVEVFMESSDTSPPDFIMGEGGLENTDKKASTRAVYANYIADTTTYITSLSGSDMKPIYHHIRNDPEAAHTDLDIPSGLTLGQHFAIITGNTKVRERKKSKTATPAPDTGCATTALTASTL